MPKKQSFSQAPSEQIEPRPASPKSRPSEVLDSEASEPSKNGDSSETAEFRTKVASRAYELFQRRGGESGRDIEDWLEAERLVRQEQHPANR